ncbi:hypothetical protein FHU10_0809 [Serratia fonticola]|uniref:Uncharacterized protein n=1 Tax=Serratia fonticola TaxID=47917 RepID=A0A542D6Y3_SERFO|nr:hypothetical protein [Serratia fonticola]TQI79123.1 hypothetical protein FHU09_1639 [Serratia fonticola]TQI98853.1 hypothetical protein FHU11_4409 [Serratia fonticola]TVZ68379.1 hypothetical protein FHU10_0809 [Serratia fonticola]
MKDKNPQDIKVNDGLTKLHEASEWVGEEEINRLVEKAKEDARINMDKHQAKQVKPK